MEAQVVGNLGEVPWAPVTISWRANASCRKRLMAFEILTALPWLVVCKGLKWPREEGIVEDAPHRAINIVASPRWMSNLSFSPVAVEACSVLVTEFNQA